MFLEVAGLCKNFQQVEVLKGIHFSMEKGQVLSIIGSSGSGKTTLLRCLNFLESADRGSIALNGNLLFDSTEAHAYTEAELRERRLHFGLVFQQFHLFPQYTVLRNLTLAPELLLAQTQRSTLGPKEEIIERGKALLEQVGLSDKIQAYPYQLSGGQQQRVAIARALMLQPDILCFDEPTSALDPELTGEVLRVIKELRDVGTTMIIVTHEMQFAAKVSDWVVYMADGVIEEQGTPEQVFTNSNNKKIRTFLQKTELDVPTK